jgi:hypothetical protein
MFGVRGTHVFPLESLTVAPPLFELTPTVMRSAPVVSLAGVVAPLLAPVDTADALAIGVE